MNVPQKNLADPNMVSGRLIGLSMRASHEGEGDMCAVMTERFSDGVRRRTYFTREQAVRVYSAYVRKTREIKARIAAERQVPATHARAQTQPQEN